MLTRLKVDGFKNLAGLDLHFGPFTCVAGPNGVGKSNLFDAIVFLSSLAQKPLLEAAMSVRGGEARHGDVQSLFHRNGNHTRKTMSFLVEMVIPEQGEDALGQQAQSAMTFLRYELKLRFRPGPQVASMGALQVVSEKAVHINRSDAKRTLGFPHKKAWRDSVVLGRRSSPYISTENEDGTGVVSLHADSIGGRGGGRPRKIPASSLPRTMLSSVTNAAEHRTLVLARQEMASWTQFQLEPSALRAPDSFTAPSTIDAHGAHLAATLYRLSQAAERERHGGAAAVFATVSNRLSALIEDVRGLHIDVDERRQLLSLILTDLRGTEHVAAALSDGTLRFLALTVMEADPGRKHLLCLEEPENGMHPLRIPAMVDLLEDLAVDVDLPVDADNPLRQVIVNTHSPAVVGCIRDDCLLVARARGGSIAGNDASCLELRHLPATWRDTFDDSAPITRGDLLAYLNPLAAVDEEQATSHPARAPRVKERSDLQMLLPFAQEPEAV